MSGTTYEDSGVNIELGDDVSKILYNAAKQTWKNREGRLGELIVPFDDFSGVRAIDVSKLPEGTLMNIGFDGPGTKIELAERIRNHRTVAFGMFAMVCDDALVRGAEPVLVGSSLDVRSLKKEDKPFLEEVNQLAEGYINAAEAANVAIVNGEVAELGNRVGGYGDFNYNWSAAVVWFARKDRLFTGREIRAGDYLVGLREDGFRSNGLSLVRRIMQDTHGENWHEETYQGRNLAEMALHPSKIYTKAIVDMFGGFEGEPRAEIHGFVHVTGGGVPGKLGRVLRPSGLGAIVVDPLKPCNIMMYCQEKGNVSDEEAYRTWNMGQGGIVITTEPSKVIDIAREHGIGSKIIGQVIYTPGIKINSQGYRDSGKVLEFH